MISIGIDLAGVEKRESGFCILNEKLEAKTLVVYKDEDIIKTCIENKPNVVAIDAPLSIPLGRKSLDKRSNIHLRECDRELLKMGIKFFPITLGPMRDLTKRGIRLKEKLEEFKLKVIEVYPGGAQDLLKIPRKKERKKLLNGLKKLGIKGLKESMSTHELDAVTCALVGLMYLKNKYISLGKEEEGLIIMPNPKFKLP